MHIVYTFYILYLWSIVSQTDMQSEDDFNNDNMSMNPDDPNPQPEEEAGSSSPSQRLVWPDFKANIPQAYQRLQIKDQSFTDVSLASDVGLVLEAHQSVLAASSPYFASIIHVIFRS